MADFLTASTIDDQDLLDLLLAEEGIVLSEPTAIGRRPAHEPVQLSFAQQRLWVLQQMEPGNPAYNTPFALRLTGRLHLPALQASFNEIVRRHEVLRSDFPSVNAGASIRLLPQAEVRLEVCDLRSLPETAQTQAVHDRIAEETLRPFDLTCAPLLRLQLLQLGEDQHILLVNMHHIIADGWSLNVWMHELSTLYPAFVLGQPSPLPALEIQYSDFSHWQRQMLAGEMGQTQLAYWRHQLADLPVLELPSDRPRPAQMTYAGASHSFTVPLTLTKKLKEIGQREDASFFMTLLAAFQVLLYRYSNQEDFAIGTGIANRNYRQIEPLIGFFVNSLVIRSQLEGQPTFRQLLRRVQATTLAAYEHQDMPFDRLVQELLPGRNLRHHPLFQVMFTLENVVDGTLSLPGLTVSQLAIDPPTAKFDLMLVWQDGQDSLLGALNYNTDLFDADRIERMASHMQTLLAAIVANPDMQIEQLAMLPSSERQQLVVKLNETATPYPADHTIVEQFERQVARTPEAIALDFNEGQMTYAQLNAEANRLAGLLRGWGVQANTAVGICVEQSLAMVVGTLAILKAGGGYVPLNPTFPAERLAFMLADTQAQVVLTQTHLRGLLPTTLPHLLCLDDPAVQGTSDHNLASINSPDDLAYIIYTSGSTGQPKGIAIPQRAVNRLVFETNYVTLDATARIGQASNFAFDAITFELWGALLHGGCLIQVDRNTLLSPTALAAHLRQKRIDTLFLTTALLNQVARSEPTAFATLRYLLFGGEAVDPRWVRAVLAAGAPQHLLHVYGPTETTTFATFYEVKEVTADAVTIPIGFPIGNTTTYILDKRMQPVPLGVPGELYIGGDGVAIGYLARAELTKEKFVDDPFFVARASLPKESTRSRLYRTGDWVRMGKDGAIEFIGRIDNQVKIRGFRIEPDEINMVIAQQTGVKESIVIVQEHPSGRRLVAYIVAQAGRALDPRQLRAALSTHLPDYMVPALFVILPALPLNANGKVDRHALPAPDSVWYEEEATGDDAPRTAEELAVAEAWQTILGLPYMGLHANYFESGGDSIKAIQVVSHLRRQGWVVDVPKVFLYPTIAELARQLLPEPANAQNQSPVEGVVPLTAIQRWFFAQPAAELNHFNQAVLLRAGERLDEQGLRAVFAALQTHHDALRMTFRFVDGSVEQVNGGVAMPLDFRLVEFLSDAQIEAAHRDLNLQTGPLLRVILYRGAAGDRLQIVIHHLVVDGVSWRILLEDLAQGYRQYLAGQAITFAPKSASFQQWATALVAYAQSEAIAPARAYWRKAELEIATASERRRSSSPKVDDPLAQDAFVATYAESTTIGMRLSATDTMALLTETHHAYTTEINDLLLTALGRALCDWRGERYNLIALEGHGRQPLPEPIDVSRTVGWFTTLFPFLLALEADEIGQQIVEVKEALRRIPNKGLEYGILKYIATHAPEAELEWRARPLISFNFLGEIDAERATALFAFAEESSGNPISPTRRRDYALDLVGVVSAGQLHFSITFAAGQVAQTQVEALLAAFQAELLAVIEHCRNKTEGEKTLSDFSTVALSADEFANILHKAQIEDIYPLAPMQEGMLFEKLYDADSPAYFVQLVYRFDGLWQADCFEQSWRWLSQRHAALRTAFVHEGVERPVQVVLKERPPEFTHVDISHLSERQQMTAVEEYKTGNLARGFDLQHEVLMRVAIFRLAADRHVFVWSYSHLLIDGWSFGILQAEFLQIYRALSRGQQPSLPTIVPYKEYIRWLQTQDERAASDFWQGYLAGYEELATLPKVTGLSTNVDYDLQKLDLSVDEARTAKLQALATRAGVTLNTLVRAIWGLILARYNGVEDVVFGAVVSGRPSNLRGVEQMMGVFINALPVRIRLAEQQTFVELLQTVQQAAFDCDPYQYLPLARVQSQSSLRTLFDHALTFENYPVDLRATDSEPDGQPEYKIGLISAIDPTHYDFDFAIAPGRTLDFHFTFNGNVYPSDQIERTATHLLTVIEQVIDNPAQLVGQISLLSVTEQRLLLEDFNASQRPIPAESLVQQFERQVATTPDALALVCGEVRWSYRRLNEQVNRIAHFLRNHYQILPEERVGILLDRSDWAIIAIWAVYKTGAAFVPIDTTFPVGRINYMLEDSGCRLVLTDNNQMAQGMVSKNIATVDIHAIEGGVTDNPPHSGVESNLAYLIYTSGSTGLPKGCQLERRNLTNCIAWRADCYYRETRRHEGESGNFAFFGSLAFDLCLGAYFTPLVHGYTLYVYPQTLSLAEMLTQVFHPQSGVDVVEMTPGQVLLLKTLDLPPSKVRFANLGGESVGMDHAQIMWQLNPQMAIVNGYGPTETTIDSIYNRIWPDDKVMLIGKPIANTQIYILNQGQLAPIGVVGEICIGGQGVGRGYWQRPALTAEKFITNPFVPGQHLYRTGDLGRWTTAGKIECFGRSDQQVKIGGYRVETGEIEHLLLQHPDIQEAAVVARNRGNDKELLAYLTGQGERDSLASALRAYLKELLPVYMIPAQFVFLQRLPLNENGKLDRKALPDPQGDETRRADAYRAPRTKVEEQLVEIWQQILGVERVGIEDNFFELGGHSLKANQVVSRIHKLLDVRVPLRTLFATATIAQLAQVIEQSNTDTFAAIQPVAAQAFYELSHAQKRLWLMHQLEGAVAYNMPEAYTLEDEQLDAEALQRAFVTLIERHEALRTAFVLVDGEPKQKIYPSLPFVLRQIDLRQAGDAEAEAKMLADQEANSPFDLSQPPLLRATLIRLSDQRSLFLLTIHHIIGDGWSGQVLYHEVLTIYEAYRRGAANPLAPLRIQYKDVTAWQNARDLSQSEKYWLEQLAGVADALRLPYDFANQGERQFRGGIEQIVLNDSQVQGLRHLAGQHKTTMANVVLALFKLLLFQVSKQSDLCVGVASANRNHPDLENLLGFFVNILPVRSQLSADMEFVDLLQQVIRKMGEAIEHQDYPFDLVVQKLNPRRVANRQPILNVIFGYQSFLDVRVDVARVAEKSARHGGQPATTAQVQAHHLNFETAKFDLTLFATEENNTLALALEYDAELFRSQTIQRYLATLQRFAQMVTG